MLRLLILLFLYAAGPGCPAQDTNVLFRAVEAFNARDVDGLLAECSADFILTLSDHSVLDSREAVEGWFNERFKEGFAPFRAITLSIDPAGLARGAPGVFRGVAEEHHELKNGKSFHFSSRWTALLREEEGAWKLAALHFGGNVFDNRILADQRFMWKQLIIFGVLAAMGAGAILGAFAMRGSRRR